ncbi:MAG: ATP-dependent zinc metalloprotease FtsH [Solirubrobacteraceae bacterium]|nr:ATP-dependent zinc metalloprotease FtsH [Solirubrobacteraceae bacterium]
MASIDTTPFLDFVDRWSTVITLVFYVAVVWLIWRSIKLMPKTAPKRIEPSTKPQVTWTEVAGADDAKEELMEVVEFLKDPRRFNAVGAKLPKGVLLHGPPGTGKTLIAKAVAHESGAQFFSQSASSFVEMFAGLGAARIRRLFREARKHAPSIIFIDEIDAVGGHRQGGGSGGNSEREQTLNQLLVEMDGFDASENVVVIAASNLLETLDAALLRPGRFDRQILVSAPDVAGREQILTVHTSHNTLGPDVDLHEIAQQTSGLTGADLANICNEAAINCARRRGDALNQLDFSRAFERIIAGVQSRRVLQPREKRIVAYHEAGHALCSELLPSVDRLHKISIVPRGKALGYVLNLPEEDRYLKSREELVDYMAMCLGGRVSEEIVFGSVTTGAASDLKTVANITHAMIYEYAMGTAETAQRAADDNHLVSDATRRVRDEERRELAFEARRSAWAIITSHRAELDALAHELLEHEVLERGQIDRIMADVKPIPGGRPSAANGYLGTSTPRRGELDDEAALQLGAMLDAPSDPTSGETARRMDDGTDATR